MEKYKQNVMWAPLLVAASMPLAGLSQEPPIVLELEPDEFTDVIVGDAPFPTDRPVILKVKDPGAPGTTEPAGDSPVSPVPSERLNPGPTDDAEAQGLATLFFFTGMKNQVETLGLDNSARIAARNYGVPLDEAKSFVSFAVDTANDYFGNLENTHIENCQRFFALTTSDGVDAALEHMLIAEAQLPSHPIIYFNNIYSNLDSLLHADLVEEVKQLINGKKSGIQRVAIEETGFLNSSNSEVFDYFTSLCERKISGQ